MTTSAIIASAGRPDVLRQTLQNLLKQTFIPSEIIISTIQESDWAPRPGDDTRIRHLFGKRGITIQLNAALQILNPESDVVFVFDDDVLLAPDYCERAVAWLQRREDVLALGGNVLRDGNISTPDAEELLKSRRNDRQELSFDSNGLYGCNMCARRAVFALENFDEKLQGYAWLFEIDWSRRVKRHGTVINVTDCHCVHLMSKSGRMPGLKIGYMQIFHPYYLWRKGVIPTSELLKHHLWRPILANLTKLCTDREVDRLGRLHGNMRGCFDIIRGRVDPKLPG